MERDTDSWEYGSAMQISTHTLTWSVTVAGKEVEYLVGNFNSHAHVERDFEICNRQNQGVYHFNSHAHVERDTNEQLKAEILRHFNSHAHVERDLVFS